MTGPRAHHASSTAKVEGSVMVRDAWIAGVLLIAVMVTGCLADGDRQTRAACA